MSRRPVILVTNPELGWDNVVGVFDAHDVSDEQHAELKALCKRQGLIMIDYRSIADVAEFIEEYTYELED